MIHNPVESEWWATRGDLVVACVVLDTVRRRADRYPRHRGRRQRNPKRLDGGTADRAGRRPRVDDRGHVPIPRRQRQLGHRHGVLTLSNLRPVGRPASPTSKEPSTRLTSPSNRKSALLGASVNFVMRTEDGTRLTPVLGAVDNELPAQDLPQGQKVSGPVPVDCRLVRTWPRLCCRTGSAATSSAGGLSCDSHTGPSALASPCDHQTSTCRLGCDESLGNVWL